MGEQKTHPRTHNLVSQAQAPVAQGRAWGEADADSGVCGDDAVVDLRRRRSALHRHEELDLEVCWTSGARLMRIRV
eukprot:CAMPEP_0194760150 /NCGR_PEP_ID=MMETSP0323_2-20130528/13109_1 /TAXON_ID=2866 ORGANISM="Crypthecodinium cohnii, Strain Seligo" /NCGR_SAMPLE_ID=MMETSP0323_2 /ASSEMBLY_ACC=CAM_ASM_000346 /LENGTH=75 /DNA_ID=CAMNT_0039681275 /DNA_START=177 /DNA_END=401 /DNA_ORIENTATION=-